VSEEVPTIEAARRGAGGAAVATVAGRVPVVPSFASVDELATALDDVGYLVDEGLATAMYLAQALGQPLLLEGEPGVGKTAAARAIAAAVGTDLLRLQCYEGIAAHEALYEWHHARQLLAVRAAESRGDQLDTDDLFGEEFLLDRPLLEAVRHDGDVPAVVLIDEVDRADDEFEALLYEFLGELSVTVPEVGTFRARRAPIVVLTSNRTRELHDALKRRCLYHWLEHPSVERAAAIVRRNVPGADQALVTAATAFVTRARDLELDKQPGLAEAIDWVAALRALGIGSLDLSGGVPALASIAKTPDDLAAVAALATEEGAA
jgi:MoxR-like ATPase